MTRALDHRGGAAIGYIEDLDAVATAAVLYLRMWFAGPDGRSRVHNDLHTAFGLEHGDRVCRDFTDLFDYCGAYARRPLMHHALRCKCLGADEACFGHFIATAADADIADARLFATLIVRADAAHHLADLATQFGFALKQMELAPLQPAHPLPTHSTRTLH